MTEPKADIEVLTAEAVADLSLISRQANASANRERAVSAAIAIESVLQLLREGRSGRAVLVELLEAASPHRVETKVLKHASGIQAFARRIRELREEGYDVRSTGTGYALLKPKIDEPNED